MPVCVCVCGYEVQTIDYLTRSPWTNGDSAALEEYIRFDVLTLGHLTHLYSHRLRFMQIVHHCVS